MVVAVVNEPRPSEAEAESAASVDRVSILALFARLDALRMLLLSGLVGPSKPDDAGFLLERLLTDAADSLPRQSQALTRIKDGVKRRPPSYRR
jgi:hypothetical protein